MNMCRVPFLRKDHRPRWEKTRSRMTPKRAQTKISRKERSLEGCVSSGVSFDRCVSNLRLRALHLMIDQLVQYLNDLPMCKIYWPLLVRGMINLKTWEESLAG